MQNQHVGDAGDFVKLALLRQLAGDEGTHPLRIGLAWYLVSDQTHLRDGRHIEYLYQENFAHLRDCDSELFDALRTVIGSGERSLDALWRYGAVPEGWIEYRAEMPLPTATDRRRRAKWFNELCHKLEAADIVFLDPDNGLRSSGLGTNTGPTESVKFTWFEEVAELAALDKSLVLYQHRDRSPDQAARILKSLASALGKAPAGWAIISHLFSQRTFYVLPSERHADVIAERIETFRRLDWKRRVEVEAL